MARDGKVLLLSGRRRARRGRARRLAHDPDAAGRSLRGPDPLRRSGAASGLSHRSAQRHRRGSATQPRKIRDGGMNSSGALDALRALGDPIKAAEMAAYHKAPRDYLGVPVPAIEALVADWRAARHSRPRRALCRPLGQRHPRGPRRRRQTADQGPLSRPRTSRLGRVPPLGPDLRRLGHRRSRLQGRRTPPHGRPLPADDVRRPDRPTPTLDTSGGACRDPSLDQKNHPTEARSRPATDSRLGRRACPGTPTGSSRKPSRGGCGSLSIDDPDRAAPSSTARWTPDPSPAKTPPEGSPDRGQRAARAMRVRSASTERTSRSRTVARPSTSSHDPSPELNRRQIRSF